MKASAVISLMAITSLAAAKEPKAVGWAVARAGEVEVRTGRANNKAHILRLGRGAVVELYGSETRAGSRWCRVGAVNLETLTAMIGWVGCAAIDTLPLDALPSDAALLAAVGGAYAEDSAASHISISRVLVRTGEPTPTLVCFIVSQFLPQGRLQVFSPVEGQPAMAGRYRPGAFLELPFSEERPGITALEVRDLLGDGNECVVSQEPVNLGRGEVGLNLVIRRIERGPPAPAGQFKKLWEAPLELRSLTDYPPRPQVLQPPEQNIGRPGTVTHGKVTFRAQGKTTVPVWAGQVEFHVLGREEPVQTMRVEKVCPWTGSGFASLR